MSEEAGTEILGETGQRLGDDACNPKPGSQGRQLLDRTFRCSRGGLEASGSKGGQGIEGNTNHKGC